MELEFKQDFEAARADWARFWRAELDRPLVAAEVPRPGVEPVRKPPYIAGHDGNFTPIIDQLLRWAETHEFVGAAIPFWYLEFAAAHFAILLGAELRYESLEGNGWVVPFVDDLAEADLRFRPDCFWWEQTVAFAEELKRRCGGRLLICTPTLVANVDALAAVYSNEKLLFDLVDRADVVHRALDQIDRAHAEIVDAFTELFDVPTWGSINRHGAYARGYTTIPQCDFSAMISADMFRKFVQPALRKEMARLDGVEYHLDGPGALQHLDALCEIDELDLIQWVPGSGWGEEQDWTDLYLRIDTLGKGQYRAGNADSLREWRDRLRTKKLFWKLGAGSRQEAEAVIAGL
jgi:5-methyltetrahydrofolate--homocysteine methyltransferase